MSDDVVVIGRLLPLDFGGGGTWGGGGGGSPGSNGWDGIYAEYPTDHPDEAVDNPYDNGPSIEANYEIIPFDVQNAMNRFRITLNNITNLVSYVNPHYDPKNFYDFHLKDGRVIYRGELSSNLSRLTFVVEPDKKFRPLFGGQMINRANGDGFVSELAPSTLLGYDAHNEIGRNYLILHELAHSTGAATSQLKEKYDLFLSRGGRDEDWSYSLEFSETERYANDIAKKFADALGVLILSLPPHGYSE